MFHIFLGRFAFGKTPRCQRAALRAAGQATSGKAGLAWGPRFFLLTSMGPQALLPTVVRWKRRELERGASTSQPCLPNVVRPCCREAAALQDARSPATRSVAARRNGSQRETSLKTEVRPCCREAAALRGARHTRRGNVRQALQLLTDRSIGVERSLAARCAL